MGGFSVRQAILCQRRGGDSLQFYVMSNTKKAFDLIVVGGGPAGYVGAIRAAQLGMNVACVERDALGGVCLNWGCIPTKALLAGAEFYQQLTNHADEWGVKADNVSHDWSKVIGRSRNVAGGMQKGIAFLFKKNKVTHVQGTARITKAALGSGMAEVDVADADGKKVDTLKAKHVLVCTGARPRELLFAPFDGQTVIRAKEAMSLPEQPKKLVIVGAGAIGMEFAYFYNAFGTEVTVVEMLDRLLPIEDADVSKAIAKSYRKQKITTLTAHKTLAIDKKNGGVEVVVAPVDDEAKKQTLSADKVLVAIGVRGNVENIADDSLGLELFKDHIKVDRRTYKTNLPGVYAVGDVIGPPWLAHVASEEAIVAVELMAGHKAEPVDYDSIPGCTYCVPQVASLGKTEQALIEAGLKKDTDYTVGQFPFQASGKAQALGHTEGFVKIVADKKYGEILGVHMIGEHVTELLAELGLAKRAELTIDEVIATMHAHPTLSEGVHEAALGAAGRMIHF